MANKKCKQCGQRKILGDFNDNGEKCNVCSPEVKTVKMVNVTKKKVDDKGLENNKGNIIITPELKRPTTKTFKENERKGV
jgi:hypothetical protein